MRDNGDGTVEGRFRLPTLHAAVLKKALDALTSPRRLGEGRLDPDTGRKLSQAVLHGRGFMDLLEHHLNLKTMPSQPGSPDHPDGAGRRVDAARRRPQEALLRLSPEAGHRPTPPGPTRLRGPPHHHMADHPETWDMRRNTDGSVRFTRRQ